MMSGSWVVGRVRILDEGLGGAGGKVETVSSITAAVVVGFFGLHVSSSSPTSIKRRPCKSKEEFEMFFYQGSFYMKSFLSTSFVHKIVLKLAKNSSAV